jgi:hypothetical protein
VFGPEAVSAVVRENASRNPRAREAMGILVSVEEFMRTIGELRARVASKLEFASRALE